MPSNQFSKQVQQLSAAFGGYLNGGNGDQEGGGHQSCRESEGETRRPEREESREHRHNHEQDLDREPGRQPCPSPGRRCGDLPGEGQVRSQIRTGGRDLSDAEAGPVEAPGFRAEPSGAHDGEEYIEDPSRTFDQPLGGDVGHSRPTDRAGACLPASQAATSRRLCRRRC